MIPARLESIASLFSEGLEDEPLSFAESRKRRQAFMRQGGLRRLRRFAVSLRYASNPYRALAALAALRLALRDRIGSPPLELPDPSKALARPDGLCGLARSPGVAGVIEGYCAGLVLFAPVGPTSWWSPSRRWAATPGALAQEAEESLAKLARLGASAKADVAFEEVVGACSEADADRARSGFAPSLTRIYFELYDSGLAHSIEIRRADGKLAAGAFGLAIGRAFMTEGCFGESEPARMAIALLDRELSSRGFVLHDARLGFMPDDPPRADLGELGFEPMERDRFITALGANLCGGGVARWRIAPADARPAEEEAASPVAKPAPGEYASAA